MHCPAVCCSSSCRRKEGKCDWSPGAVCVTCDGGESVLVHSDSSGLCGGQWILALSGELNLFCAVGVADSVVLVD